MQAAEDGWGEVQMPTAPLPLSRAELPLLTFFSGHQVGREAQLSAQPAASFLLGPWGHMHCI